MTTTKKAAAKKAAPKQAAKKSAKKTNKKKTATSVKKSAAKATPKKRATKTAGGKKGTARPLKQAGSKEAFWATNGEIINNLLELRDALARMDDKVYAYHVTKEKNDFADWVEAVLKDTDCAAAMRRARKPGTARGVVAKHLKFYSY